MPFLKLNLYFNKIDEIKLLDAPFAGENDVFMTHNVTPLPLYIAHYYSNEDHLRYSVEEIKMLCSI